MMVVGVGAGADPLSQPDLCTARASPGRGPACRSDRSLVKRWRPPARRTTPRVRGRTLRHHGANRWHGKTPAGAGMTDPQPPGANPTRGRPRGWGATASPRHDRDRRRKTPRVRGRPRCHGLRRGQEGKTPAGAGTTRSPGCRRPHPTEDPRGCGDDPCIWSMSAAVRGRPPRVRGRHTKPLVVSTTSWKDPRGCGDDRRDTGARPNVVGRPPRVRGRRQHVLPGQHVGRKTPAGAGTTASVSPAAVLIAEDPRGCGDDASMIPPTTFPAGRPPRVRGRRLDHVPQLPVRRKTPAGAGTTSRGSPPRRGRWEDPRGCGDDLRRHRTSK